MRLKYRKKTAAFLLVIVLSLCMGATVLAKDVPDLKRKGDISLTFEYEKKAVPGGTLAYYRVGQIAQDDGNYEFAISLEFVKSGEDLSDISSAGLAGRLAAYASEQQLTGTSINIGNNGQAVFSDLDPGLYLIVQTRSADGFEAVSPFLVSLPMLDEETGKYVYEVDATPKMEPLKKTPDEPDEPDEPDKPDEPGTPGNPNKPNSPGSPTGSPGGSTLPQTGQLNWPVPFMAVLGVGLFLFGWALRYGKGQRM